MVSYLILNICFKTLKQSISTFVHLIQLIKLKDYEKFTQITFSVFCYSVL